MSQFHYTPQADADLDAITDFFADRNPDAGLKLLDKIETQCRFLAKNPRVGRPRADLGAGVRSSLVGRYLVFFRAVSTGVAILRVLHGSRDITPDLFD